MNFIGGRTAGISKVVAENSYGACSDIKVENGDHSKLVFGRSGRGISTVFLISLVLKKSCGVILDSFAKS